MVRIDVELDVPVQEAFDYFSDFRNENEWNVVAHDVVMTTDIPIQSTAMFQVDQVRCSSRVGARSLFQSGESETSSLSSTKS